ncbi:sensor histidine kinase [Mucilaginibacter ginkgonis]|uniref:histidine kinase n=1 Tax=Mucilaginibacter ginkgonis TaxID=2682091 RepID=A0A6I4HZT7_9SPHI|nr:HAMP domain-containing sensor histidine kinase [Mucilaginibacter ginkgonis]QQL48944.1 sensor histidine kinase [Mucilaginibacter ginkgonis]
MDTKLNTVWLRLIGSSDDFSFESRIFHSISIGLAILAVFYVSYNFYGGFYTSSLSILAVCLLFSYEYYQSRCRNKNHNSFLFGVVGLVLFSINYFANWGIDSSTDIIWRAYLFFLLITSPYRQHLLWLISYIALFLIFHLIAYYHPEVVKHPFAAAKDEILERITAFPLPLLILYLVINYVRKRYDNARIIAEEKTIAITAQHAQISLQKELIEKADAEKNKLMSIISHDMRAPIISIQGYLQLMGDNELDMEDRAMIEKDLLIATNSTMDMLTNLLQWSKSQMEGPAVNLSTVNLLDTLQSTLDMCRLHAGKKDITLSYEIDPAIMVVADADMLQLVIRNLVSNAIKFTPGGGTISVNAEIIDGECKITVSDNGKGIDHDKQKNIFSLDPNPGYGTNNEKGVGLGLTLCKEFIERQNGHISFESQPGQGSSFFVYVPMISH